MKKILICLLCIFSAACFGNCKKDCFTSGEPIVSNLEVKISQEIRAINVVYKYDALSDSWRLLFRKKNNFSIIKNDQTLYPPEGISSDLIATLVDKSIETLMAEKKYVRLDQIQLELRIASDVWGEIVEKIKHVAKHKKGFVRHKDEEIYSLVLRTLDSSILANRICNQVKMLSLNCANPRIGLDPIAFKDNWLGKQWQSLIPIEDAGLANEFWISIRFTKKTFDQTHQ